MPNIRLRRAEYIDSANIGRRVRSALFPGVVETGETRGFEWDCPSCSHVNQIRIEAGNSAYATNTMNRFQYPTQLVCGGPSCLHVWLLQTRGAVVGSTNSLYIYIGVAISPPDDNQIHRNVPTEPTSVTEDRRRRDEMFRQMTQPIGAAPLGMRRAMMGPPAPTNLMATLNPEGFQVTEATPEGGVKTVADLPYESLTPEQQLAWLEATGKKVSRMQLLFED